MPGILNVYKTNADQLFTTNVVLASLNLGGTGGMKIAANQTMRVRYWVKATVGATGGLRAQVVVPAGGTIYSTTIRLNNTVAPGTVLATQQASAAFTNALANAGTHWLEIDVIIVNGAVAGLVDLQMAQNTSDALTLTILRGATAEQVLL